MRMFASSLAITESEDVEADAAAWEGSELEQRGHLPSLPALYSRPHLVHLMRPEGRAVGTPSRNGLNDSLLHFMQTRKETSCSLPHLLHTFNAMNFSAQNFAK